MVADVGGVYDPAKHRYDHHQRCIARLESAYSVLYFKCAYVRCVTFRTAK